jgi:hypothetical protein
MVERNYDRRKQIFYKKFYMRLGFITSNIHILFNNMNQIVGMGFKLLRYLWWDKEFIIGGRKGVLDK